MNRTKTSFIEHRIQALATVFLTGRNNVETYSLNMEDGPDLLARVISPEDDFEMFFGVILTGTSEELSTGAQAAAYLNAWFEGHDGKLIRRRPFPVIALIFSMQRDDGFYAWLDEPIVEATSLPGLRSHSQIECSRANRHGLDRIVNQIRLWYKAFYEAVRSS